MIYIDTNVLVRMITQDIPGQAEVAYDSIAKGRANDFIITEIVLVELTFILQYHDYKMDKKVITEAILDIFDTEQIASASDEVTAALKLYAKTKLDFVDCLLHARAKGKKAGVLTFDKGLVAALR